jgi:putative ABC transport system permease protein
MRLMIFEQCVDDLRLAWRGLRRAKAFTAAAVFTLAVGIAGTTVMFALIHGVLLRPLPVREQDRLVVAWKELRTGAAGHWPYRAGEIVEIARSARLLDRVAGVGYNGATPFVGIENGSASYINGASVTGRFFDVIGVEPVLGRALTDADDVAGAEKVLVITDGLWQRRYGGTRDVVGRRLIVNNHAFTIVGVMPSDIEYPRGVEAWMSVATLTSILTNPAFRVDLDLVARLRPGVTIEQAASELQGLTSRLEAAAPSNAPRGGVIVVRSYADVLVGDVRVAMLVLFGAVGLVLLIASANVANLLLLRGEARRSELAVRAALGASRIRLVRQLVAESVLLALAAGAVGLLITGWALQAVVALVPEGLPRVESVRVDAIVVLFTVAVAFVTAALAGLVPALSSAREDLGIQLRSGGRGTTPSAARHGRRGLVVAQVALAVTIVAAAGLLTRSLLRLQAADMGLATNRLVFVQLSLPQPEYADRGRHLRFLDDVVAELEAVPGIAAATPVNAAPFAGTGAWDALITGEGQSAEQAAANPLLNLEAIHANYFETFEVTLVRGRPFTEADRQGAPEVAIVSEDVAARTWPGQDPIGKRIKLGPVNSRATWRTVIGVAARTRYRELADPRPTLYLPAEQFIVSAQMLVLRTSSPLALVSAAARERIARLDADVQVMRVAPFTQMLARPLARPRFNAFLIGIFGLAALILAAVGLYAVMAAYVRQRDAEIGVRVALGATAADVRRLVLGEGLLLAGSGALIGIVSAAAGSRFLRGLLFDVEPLDPTSITAAALLLVGVSMLAAYVPARRATRVDPIIVLRAS